MTNSGTGKSYRFISLERKVISFFFFLALAVLFWFLSILNQEYTTNLKYALDITDLPENKCLWTNENPQLDLTVTGPGYTLVWYKLNAHQAHSFSLRSIPIQYASIGGESSSWIPERFLRDRIQYNLGTDLIISRVSPDTLFLPITERISKKLPVTPRINLQFAKQHMNCGKILIEPDSAILEGPKKIIDTLTFLSTEYFRSSPLKKDYNVILPLDIPELLQTSTEKVSISVCVEKFTEITLKVPIQGINVPEGMELKTFPAEAQVSFRIGLSRFSKVQPDQFLVAVDYKAIDPQGKEKIPVFIKRKPEYIEGLKLNLKSVDYIIEK